MDNFLLFIIAILATWRISALFSYETGPFEVFTWIREVFGIVHDDEGNKIVVPDSFFAELLDCIWCVSWWIGLTIALFMWGFGLTIPKMFIFYPFALSAGAIMIEKVNHG